MLNSCMSKELYTSFQLLYINDKGQKEILFKNDRIITIFGIIFQHVVYYYNSCWDVVNNNIHSMITITKGTINIYFITITSRELILCCCCYYFCHLYDVLIKLMQKSICSLFYLVYAKSCSQNVFLFLYNVFKCILC